MDNRPVSIKEPIVFFRKSNAAFKINYQEGFDMPAKIEVEFWSDRVKVDIGPEVTAQISGNTAEFDIPLEVVRILPPQLEAYFLHDGDFLFAGKVFVQMGAAENPSVMELSVSVGSDQVINVEVVGLALIQEQVAIATAAASAASNSAAMAASEATVATTKAGEANASAEAAEAARDVAVANAVERIDVATYAAAVPYFSGSQPREIYVAADEAYYEGEASWYKYVPGIGEALFGIDFNYKE